MTARRASHFLQAVTGSEAPFTLACGDALRPLARVATIAGDSEGRRRGLLGRASIGDDEALVIAPTQGIHTFGMRFAVDVVFVDRAGAVLKVAPAVPPNRLRLCWRAFAAIELAAGRSAAAGVRPGVTIVAVSTPAVFLA